MYNETDDKKNKQKIFLELKSRLESKTWKVINFWVNRFSQSFEKKEEAYPEAVKTFDRDGITYKAVAYDKLTAVLAAQLNEAVEELRQLKARVESIEKANN